MPRPVCVSCNQEYRVASNDAVAEEVADFGSYRLWLVDLWRCPCCGHEILSGFGNKPYAEHWQKDYEAKRADCRERTIRFGDIQIPLGNQGDGTLRVEKATA